jgi:hypothetical protein
MKQSKLNVIVAVTLFPVIILVFFLDRGITAPMFWLDNIRIKYWLEQPKEIASSLLRCLALGILLLITSLFFV